MVFQCELTLRGYFMVYFCINRTKTILDFVSARGTVARIHSTKFQTDTLILILCFIDPIFFQNEGLMIAIWPRTTCCSEPLVFPERLQTALFHLHLFFVQETPVSAKLLTSIGTGLAQL